MLPWMELSKKTHQSLMGWDARDFPSSFRHRDFPELDRFQLPISTCHPNHKNFQIHTVYLSSIFLSCIATTTWAWFWLASYLNLNVETLSFSAMPWLASGQLEVLQRIIQPSTGTWRGIFGTWRLCISTPEPEDGARKRRMTGPSEWRQRKWQGQQWTFAASKAPLI